MRSVHALECFLTLLDEEPAEMAVARDENRETRIARRIIDGLSKDMSWT
jgi:hypothetical protein